MSKKLLKIHRALISVSNKSKILELAHILSIYDIQLIATKGSTKKLLKSGFQVTEISKYTDFPEIMDGRIKTLHTKIYAGILARPQIDNNILKQYLIEPIDMVVVNFYPYIQNIPENYNINKNINYNHINDITIENIDIGGPSIVRSAAKNYKNVVVIVDSNDYINIINELNNNNGKISIETRFALASKAFQYVATYDTLISNHFKKQSNKNQYLEHLKNKKKQQIHFPDYITCMNTNFIKKENMRYGENPHQSAAFYIESQNLLSGSIGYAQKLQGKKLSYNNIIDIDTALECVKMFTEPTCVIVKHGNPCGAASSNTLLKSYIKAYKADHISSFGGVIAFNKTLDKETAQTIIEQQFTEAIIAPSIDQCALNILNNKQNIRVLTCGTWEKIKKHTRLHLEFKKVNGGLLIQNKNIHIINEKNIQIVTKRKPNNNEVIDALFCWKIVQFIKSNAIIYGKNKQTLGIGSGQTSRIYAAKIAELKAKDEGFNLKGSIMASDAFLPFSDTIDIASKIGITCIIQPGGGIQDKNIIANANKNNISMIFTHMRHFRH